MNIETLNQAVTLVRAANLIVSAAMVSKVEQLKTENFGDPNWHLCHPDKFLEVFLATQDQTVSRIVEAAEQGYVCAIKLGIKLSATTQLLEVDLSAETLPELLIEAIKNFPEAELATTWGTL